MSWNKVPSRNQPVTQKLCKSPSCNFAGKPQPVINFYNWDVGRDRLAGPTSHIRYSPHCKKCIKDRAKQKRRKNTTNYLWAKSYLNGLRRGKYKLDPLLSPQILANIIVMQANKCVISGIPFVIPTNDELNAAGGYLTWKAALSDSDSLLTPVISSIFNNGDLMLGSVVFIAAGLHPAVQMLGFNGLHTVKFNIPVVYSLEAINKHIGV